MLHALSSKTHLTPKDRLSRLEFFQKLAEALFFENDIVKLREQPQCDVGVRVFVINYEYQYARTAQVGVVVPKFMHTRPRALDLNGHLDRLTFVKRLEMNNDVHPGVVESFPGSRNSCDPLKGVSETPRDAEEAIFGFAPPSFLEEFAIAVLHSWLVPQILTIIVRMVVA